MLKYCILQFTDLKFKLNYGCHVRLDVDLLL